MRRPLEDDALRGTDAKQLAAACVAAVAATIALVALRSDAYAIVLGLTRPIGAMVVVVALGFLGWWLVSRESWIPTRTEAGQGYRSAALIGAALPIPVIVVDWLGGFEREMNVRAPDSFLFYPSIAVAAELVFHVAPLALAATLAFLVRRAESASRLIGFGAAVAIEPILQAMWGAKASPTWANAYVGVHLLVFNLVGVHLLRRFGILRVLLFRLSYYLVWHILWGFLRLPLLFQA